MQEFDQDDTMKFRIPWKKTSVWTLKKQKGYAGSSPCWIATNNAKKPRTFYMYFDPKTNTYYSSFQKYVEKNVDEKAEIQQMKPALVLNASFRFE